LGASVGGPWPPLAPKTHRRRATPSAPSLQTRFIGEENPLRSAELLRFHQGRRPPLPPRLAFSPPPDRRATGDLNRNKFRPSGLRPSAAAAPAGKAAGWGGCRRLAPPGKGHQNSGFSVSGRTATRRRRQSFQKSFESFGKGPQGSKAPETPPQRRAAGWREGLGKAPTGPHPGDGSFQAYPAEVQGGGFLRGQWGRIGGP